MNVLKLEEDTKVNEYIKDKITYKNVTTFYQFAKLYKLTSIADITLSYIERCFSMVAETQNFLELEFIVIRKILASSDLSVHSELEVYNAANDWLKHDITQRSKFAKQLLLKVRLPLLSEHTVKYILNKNSHFTENNECVDIMKKTLSRKENMLQNNQSNYNRSRYCNQNKFNILICGN